MMSGEGVGIMFSRRVLYSVCWGLRLLRFDTDVDGLELLEQCVEHGAPLNATELRTDPPAKRGSPYRGTTWQDRQSMERQNK